MMRMFLFAAAFAVSTVAATGVFAADVPQAQPGEMLRDSNNERLGPIQDVASDGTVGIIIDSQYVQVPPTELKMVDGKVETTVPKSQLQPQ